MHVHAFYLIQREQELQLLFSRLNFIGYISKGVYFW